MQAVNSISQLLVEYCARSGFVKCQTGTVKRWCIRCMCTSDKFGEQIDSLASGEEEIMTAFNRND